jgi:hypothetical protein
MALMAGRISRAKLVGRGNKDLPAKLPSFTDIARIAELHTWVRLMPSAAFVRADVRRRSFSANERRGEA